MASGATLGKFFPDDNEYPAANYATYGKRNGHPVLEFDPTTQEGAAWSDIMPRNYGGNGITVYAHAYLASAITGTLGWIVSIERLSDGVTDGDADSYATGQTITAATVPGTSGVDLVLSVSITNGANMDGVVAGDLYRVRIQRDVANDNAAGDAQLLSVEIKET